MLHKKEEEEEEGEREMIMILLQIFLKLPNDPRFYMGFLTEKARMNTLKISFCTSK